MFDQRQAKLLGLTKKERKLLSILDETPRTVSDLARKSKLNRTGLYTPLKQLHRRGLISRVKVGRRFNWQAVPPERLRDLLFDLTQNHTPANKEASSPVSSQEIGIIASQFSQYKIYRGRDKLISIYRELAKLPKNTRLFGIQPNLSVDSSFRQAPAKLMTEINQAIKKRGIIVEAILSEDFLSEYIKTMKKKRLDVEVILESFGRRRTVTTYVPSELMDFDSELIFFSDTVLITNWSELTAVIIKNRQIVGIFRTLFELAKSAGNRVDQNPKIEELLSTWKQYASDQKPKPAEDK